MQIPASHNTNRKLNVRTERILDVLCLANSSRVGRSECRPTNGVQTYFCRFLGLRPMLFHARVLNSTIVEHRGWEAAATGVGCDAAEMVQGVHLVAEQGQR